jgi:hypothetical protein
VEADHIGVVYMARAGYDPRDAAPPSARNINTRDFDGRDAWAQARFSSSPKSNSRRSLMSSTQVNDRSTTIVSVPPTKRRAITSVASYSAAERAVDWLSDRGFPVQHVQIVGTGLRYVEQVSGRVTTGRAALIGIGQGAVLGLFWGLLFSLFFTTTTGSFLGVLAFSVVVGVVFGGIVGAVSHSATNGRRDFGSGAQTRADRYEVQVDDGFADEAERVLARMPSR